ncbi:hypothetical protein [Thermoflavimicrobium dichotomicum]|nr:hypothetical protein [Thermoflavimicrobium dichotomicum]
MANSFPKHLPKDAHPENKLLFHTLKQYLPPDYLVFYQQTLFGYQPEFTIIGPDLGLIVLEVEHLSHLSTWYPPYSLMHPNTVIITPALLRARNYACQISHSLQQKIQHTQGSSSFSFPYGYGIVFTQLYQENLKQKGLASLLHCPYVLTRDDIDPCSRSFSSEALLQCLKKLIANPCPISVSLLSYIMKTALLQVNTKDPLMN